MKFDEIMRALFSNDDQLHKLCYKYSEYTVHIYIIFKIGRRKTKEIVVYLYCIFNEYTRHTRRIYNGIQIDRGIYMDRIKDKASLIQGLNWRVIARFGLAVLLVAVVVWGCISTSNASNMRRKYAQSREAVGENLYSAAYMMALKYDDAALAGADVEGEILPAMKTYYAQALALNEAMAGAYGARYEILSDALVAELDQAFSAYDEAFRAGRSTEDAAKLMLQAVQDTRAALDKKYDGNGRLQID